MTAALALAVAGPAEAAFWETPVTVSGTADPGEIAFDTSPAGHSLLVATGSGDAAPARATVAAAGPGALPTAGTTRSGEGADACAPAASVRADGTGLAAWCTTPDPEEDLTVAVAGVVSSAGEVTEVPVPESEDATVLEVAAVAADDGLWVITVESAEDSEQVVARRFDGVAFGAPQVLSSSAAAAGLEAASTTSGAAVVTWRTDTELDDGPNVSSVRAARSVGGTLVPVELESQSGTIAGGELASGASVVETRLTAEADPVLRVRRETPDFTGTEVARTSVGGIFGIGVVLPTADVTTLAGGAGAAAVQGAGPAVQRAPFGTTLGSTSPVTDLGAATAGDLAGAGRRAPADSVLVSSSPDVVGPGELLGVTDEEGRQAIESGVEAESLRLLATPTGVLGAFVRPDSGVAVVRGLLRPGVPPSLPISTPVAPPEPAAPAPAPPPPPRDRTAPSVTGLVLSSARFRLATGASSFTGPKAAARSLQVRRLGRGTILRFRLSERARLQVDAYRLKLQSGPGARRRCGTPLRPRGGKARKVASWRATRGAGPVRVAFGGRRGSTALTRGRYVMRVVAADAAGNRRIVRSPRFTLC